ncbi:MAG: replication-associated recombination protein A [Deltaproteobacteria bacterium]|nr:replication-associated recombination protein A [Deltaproteobacteria bacterium]
MDLFEHSAQRDQAGVPLADRLRPTRLEEIVGQEQLLSEGKVLFEAIREDRIPSMILWGPPGTGKTTLARVIANQTKANFITFSAVLGGVAELRKAVHHAAEQRRLYRRGTVLFIDEIHRFNKAQQDALLPHVESGTVVLIGATTENPSFAINASLLSRTAVFRLEPLSADALVLLLKRALDDSERGLGGRKPQSTEEALKAIASYSQGDARRALDVLEIAASHASTGSETRTIDEAVVEQALASRTLLYDRNGEEHYNVVSAFIKSMRGSDPDAAIYWMMRMLEAGDDPLFIIRRMLIFASEDIGNAEPRALQVAVAADEAFRRLGMPEGLFPLAQCCTFLACAPKSNASYLAWTEAQRDVRELGALAVPLKLRNPVTKEMKQWGYGENYRYPHDEQGYIEGETYLPDRLVGKRYYRPKPSGFEARIRERLENLRGRSKKT